MPEARLAAVVERGTTPRQRVVTATVGTLAQRAAETGIEPPALAIIGEVVGLRQRLDWFGVAEHTADARAASVA